MAPGAALRRRCSRCGAVLIFGAKLVLRGRRSEIGTLEVKNVVLRDRCKGSDDLQNTWQAQGIVHIANSLAGAMNLKIVDFVAGAVLGDIFLFVFELLEARFVRG